jgi:hypothetical protein
MRLGFEVANKIAENMKRQARYQKIVSRAYQGEDAERFNALSREIKLCVAELFEGTNEKLYAEIRKDLMTLGVGCIYIFEEHFSEEIEDSESWNEVRTVIFDKIAKILTRYEELLLK